MVRHSLLGITALLLCRDLLLLFPQTPHNLGRSHHIPRNLQPGLHRPNHRPFLKLRTNLLLDGHHPSQLNRRPALRAKLRHSQLRQGILEFTPQPSIERLGKLIPLVFHSGSIQCIHDGEEAPHNLRTCRSSGVGIARATQTFVVLDESHLTCVSRGRVLFDHVLEGGELGLFGFEVGFKGGDGFFEGDYFGVEWWCFWFFRGGFFVRVFYGGCGFGVSIGSGFGGFIFAHSE
mmetsp:Transcript_19518/g.31625  ORF Transcript_19518/g.31625 Transcript_19518/m.31625 type:complete len:233 (+) Transcript_19518:297-995(+)